MERHPLESFICPNCFIGASYHSQMSSLSLHTVACMQTVGSVSSMLSQKLDIDKASPQPVTLEQCHECATDCAKKQLLLPVKYQ